MRFASETDSRSSLRRVHADADVSIFRVADSEWPGTRANLYVCMCARARREVCAGEEERTREREKSHRSYELTRIRKVVEVESTDEETDFRIILKRRQRRLIDISMEPP